MEGEGKLCTKPWEWVFCQASIIASPLYPLASSSTSTKETGAWSRKTPERWLPHLPLDLKKEHLSYPLRLETQWSGAPFTTKPQTVPSCIIETETIMNLLRNTLYRGGGVPYHISITHPSARPLSLPPLHAYASTTHIPSSVPSHHGESLQLVSINFTSLCFQTRVIYLSLPPKSSLTEPRDSYDATLFFSSLSFHSFFLG